MSQGHHPGLDRLLDDAAYARSAADSLQALAAPSRLRILARLHAGPAAVGMEDSAVSHQLRLMRHLGLVAGERDGRRVVYRLFDAHVSRLIEQAVSHVDHVRAQAGRAEEAA